MHAIFGPLPLVAGIIAGVVWIAATRAEFTAGGHLADSQCTSCHLADKKLTAENANVLIGSQEELCATCHPSAIKLSHSSGIQPSGPLPEKFPLDWKGDLTCSTCHDIHSAEPGLPRSENQGQEFCMECHTEEFFSKMLDEGLSITTSGHLSGETSKVSDLPVDQFSIQCIGCHTESSTSGNNLISVSNVGLVRHGASEMSHPIGSKYEESTSFGGYRSLAQLPEEIILPDGKVGCISCHEGYSEKHGALVIDNAGSALCVSCHDI